MPLVYSRSWRRVLLGMGLTAVAACSDSPTGAAVGDWSVRHPADLSAEWAMASPTAVGIDSVALSAAVRAAPSIAGLTGLVIVRHGYLVAEWYRDPGGRDSLYSLRSVTKSVMSLLVGIAVDRGIVHGVSDPLAAFWRPSLPALSTVKGAITIRDLLTMTSGFEWYEEEDVNEYNNWAAAPDQIAYLLARPLVAALGAQFNYNSAAVHLLSVVLADTAPGGTVAFADEALFSALGIHSVAWEFDNRHIPNGGAGLYLRPRDMAKVGELVLQQGASGAHRVVSSSWVRNSTSPQVLPTRESLSTLGPLEYGYLWWLGTVGDRSVTFAWGYGGQFVAIVPDLDLVIVTTATWIDTGGTAPADADRIMNWMVRSVFPVAH